ncbi:BlaI/MecI/CopY family transcriptional regulator [Clostridium sp. MSJ-11]|uniref:BlaI/MecI/CopY family transcriptional regulator n=1 Tax=Clostridium mobile TaxID=2841512 RepID=A0ABS6EDY2_9CLOT|nr:BlaI/MecI/CopY family transcriptional regulator [Clostridium mobile]MBU5482710.1 BlaI/MecI/CopY family transcriptional regulator [Clostridium mobile]
MSNLPKISDAEWEVMKLLWDKGNITSKEIVEALKSTTNWSSTTIYTLINRLVKKNAVGIKEGTSPYICYPLVSQEELRTEESKSFLKKVFDGSLNLMLVNFVKNEKLSNEEIEDLKNILENRKE